MSTPSRLAQQVQLAKIRDQFFYYLADQDGFLDKETSQRMEHLMRAYAYLESLIERRGSI
jgi:hypothetical protein